MTRKSAKPHGFTTKGIHWISAILVGYGYLKGLDNISQLSDPAVLRFEVLYALALGTLFAVRFLWTKYVVGATRLPADAPKWEHRLSRAVHLGLYASVFGVISSGLGIAWAYSVWGSGGIAVAPLVGFHEFFLMALPALLCAHIGGALWHRFVRRDGVLESMTGRFSTAFGRQLIYPMVRIRSRLLTTSSITPLSGTRSRAGHWPDSAQNPFICLAH